MHNFWHNYLHKCEKNTIFAPANLRVPSYRAFEESKYNEK